MRCNPSTNDYLSRSEDSQKLMAMHLECKMLLCTSHGVVVVMFSSKGPTTCSLNETQQVADAYCQGVGFQTAYFWRATSLNDTLCFPSLGGIDDAECDNLVEGINCQGFERIVCTGACSHTLVG